MGLDMYLEKIPRYKDASINDVYAIDCYLDWQESKKDNNQYANCTLKEWCGISEGDLPSADVIDFYKKIYDTKYYYWDQDHTYGYKGIIEQVAYWRKANQIHNWFVENVQDGCDDCEYHREVTQQDLKTLLNLCETVLGKCVVQNDVISNKEATSTLEKSKVVTNVDIAEDLLPTCSGFFFGGCEYDEFYIDDIVETVNMIKRILATTDFKKEAIYYRSSW